tara:strand:+ start:69 stop:551 length:483 start_codon:yes stop_codon:yes gene_type:complete
MNLRDKLSEDTILVPMEAGTCAEAIQELLSHLQSFQILSSTHKLFSCINEQENFFTSAAGRGIAYPHSTSIELDQLVCLLGISSNGIDFKSPDGQLCHVILLTLSPKEDPSEHRKFVTRFRTMVEDPQVRACLSESNSSREAINIISDWEDSESDPIELT